MGNMPYCRFRNTLMDLRECYNSMQEDEELEVEEQKAKVELIELCATIIQRFGKEAQ